jgi:hypothetical protein
MTVGRIEDIDRIKLTRLVFEERHRTIVYGIGM